MANFVQGVSGTYSNTSPVHLVFGSNNTAGNLLVCFFNGTASGTPGISDSAGNTWTQLFDSVNSPSSGEHCTAWYTIAKGGANTVTLTDTGISGFIGACCGEWANVNALDINQRQNTANTPTVTTNHATETLIGLFASNGGYTGGGASLTQREAIALTGTNFAIMADRDVTSTQTGYTTSAVGGTTTWFSAILSFYKPSVAAEGGITGRATEVASSIKAAEASIVALTSKIASSLKAAEVGITGRAIEIASSLKVVSAAISGLATKSVTHNVATASAHIAAAESLVASSIRAGSVSLSTASVESITHNLKAASALIHALSSELASNKDAGEGATAAHATVVASSLEPSAGRISASAVCIPGGGTATSGIGQIKVTVSVIALNPPVPPLSSIPKFGPGEDQKKKREKEKERKLKLERAKVTLRKRQTELLVAHWIFME